MTDPLETRLEEIGARLLAAERICVLVGATHGCSGASSPRDKALTQMWLDWSRQADEHGWKLPEITDEEIAELARRRDEIRAATLARMSRVDNPVTGVPLGYLRVDDGDDSP